MVLVLRIDPDAAEPPLVTTRRSRSATPGKGVPAVVGHVETLVRPVRRAEHHVHPVVVRRRDADADAPEARVTGQPRTGLVVVRHRADDVLQPLPAVAAVVGAEQSGADAAVGAGAVVALVVPQRGEDTVVVGRVDRQVDPAGRVVGRRQDQLPVLAAVVDPVDPPLRHRGRDRTCGGDEDPLRIGGVDDDPADRGTVYQAPLLPTVPTVGRAVDAVAEEGQAAAGRVRLAGTRPQRPVGTDRERPHGLGRVVGPTRLPGVAGIHAPPHAAAGHRGVQRVSPGRVYHQVDNPGTHVRRPDHAPRSAGTLRHRGRLLHRPRHLVRRHVPPGRPLQGQVVRRSLRSTVLLVAFIALVPAAVTVGAHGVVVGTLVPGRQPFEFRTPPGRVPESRPGPWAAATGRRLSSTSSARPPVSGATHGICPGGPAVTDQCFATPYALIDPRSVASAIYRGRCVDISRTSDLHSHTKTHPRPNRISAYGV